MEKNNPVPVLVTFDGEARSGKGTIVQATKDHLRDNTGHKVMLIDAGQVFRVLVVAATRSGVDLNDPAAIDAFLGSDVHAEECVQLVRDVYHMDKDERDALLYTNEVGENSAKVGARPLSQQFKDELLKKWLRDARIEGYEIVLLDGRALEEVGTVLENEGLCDFRLALYFICDPVVGARRTLGFATRAYDDLNDDEKKSVDTLVGQIKVRNDADRERPVQPLLRPAGVSKSILPDVVPSDREDRPTYLLDTSKDMTKEEMSSSVITLVAETVA